ncbi:surfeit locus protein 1-like [Papaver somniferum]|uniref:surfeit locus protein 1-like n=1 Tax=Papaver somniferum TaxID=3469 RepID=UPI000E6FE0FE|nr:surfeit locus protein 1-like [Papaver somniferum]
MTSSISKTLNLQTYSSIFSSANRIPKLTPLFSTSNRVLSTLAESPIESSFQPQERKSWSRYLLFLPGAITFGLGTWQIFRRQDKVEMLDYRRNRLGLDPVVWNNISSSSSGDSGSLEFRRVMCEGIFDESKSIYVGPRSRSISGVTENGYYVITPLVPNSSDPKSVQSSVLVNRGWAPRSWREKHQKDSQNVEPVSNIKIVDDGETEGSSRWKFWSKKPIAKTVEDPVISSTPSVKVIGVIRGSEKPSIFVPANDPSSGQWFYVDVPAIARAAGLPEDTLYLEDINDNVDHGNPYPLPKDVNTLIRSSTMPQDHLNYTLTWYSLSAAVTFMAVKRLKPKKIRR